ncbi:RING finger protein 10 [Cladochytrium tenue]|nr:RING finger protein 10 [Cladochytrium tenue]
MASEPELNGRMPADLRGGFSAAVTRRLARDHDGIGSLTDAVQEKPYLEMALQEIKKEISALKTPELGPSEFVTEDGRRVVGSTFKANRDDLVAPKDRQMEGGGGRSSEQPSLGPGKVDKSNRALRGTFESYFFFFQAADGEHVYLHPLDVRILKHEFGDYEKFPLDITLPVVTVQESTMTERRIAKEIKEEEEEQRQLAIAAAAAADLRASSYISIGPRSSSSPLSSWEDPSVFDEMFPAAAPSTPTLPGQSPGHSAPSLLNFQAPAGAGAGGGSRPSTPASVFSFARAAARGTTAQQSTLSARPRSALGGASSRTSGSGVAVATGSTTTTRWNQDGNSEEDVGGWALDVALDNDAAAWQGAAGSRRGGGGGKGGGRKSGKKTVLVSNGGRRGQ